MERDQGQKEHEKEPQISTHTLTWSVTCILYIAVKGTYNFNSHAHVERDRKINTPYNIVNHFNSHAHVERDCRNWLETHGVQISTHTLTWSVTTTM